MSAEKSVKIKKRSPEETVEYIISEFALQKIEIDKIKRAIGIAGYFSENPPISIQEHHRILVKKLSDLLTDIKIFYKKERKYMGEWFDKQFNEFMVKMEEKYLK